MRTVKSEKEKERIRKRVEEIGGGGLDWEEGYRKLSSALSGDLSGDMDELTAEEAKGMLGDSLSIAKEADRCSRIIKVSPVSDVGYTSTRPAYEEIEDIYHQWFPEDRDAAFTEEAFKELPKRIIALTLETMIASEITEMLLSLTSIKRREYDTPFLFHLKKRVTDTVKRFSLNTENITKLALKELERNFSLPRNDSYHTLLDYLFGPKQNVPSIKRFVQAKHPDWFTYYDEPGDDSSESTKTSSYSLDDEWFVVDPKTCKTKSMSGREIVVGLEKGTLSEKEVFRDLPKPVQAFIKEELEKYKSKLLYGEWGFTADEGTPLTRETRKTMDDMIKILKSGEKDLFKESGTSRCEDKD